MAGAKGEQGERAWVRGARVGALCRPPRPVSHSPHPPPPPHPAPLTDLGMSLISSILTVYHLKNWRPKPYNSTKNSTKSNAAGGAVVAVEGGNAAYGLYSTVV
jgi:hypothetical protein